MFKHCCLLHLLTKALKGSADAMGQLADALHAANEQGDPASIVHQHQRTTYQTQAKKFIGALAAMRAKSFQKEGDDRKIQGILMGDLGLHMLVPRTSLGLNALSRPCILHAA